MKRIYLAFIAGLLLMVPLAAGTAYAADTSKSPPPIGQKLVREGDYAVKLALALKVGPATTEADAENALVTVGIAPDRGWISDFPITPDILAQLQTSIDTSSSSGKLAMSKADAYSAYQALNAEAGLSAITAGDPGAKITEYNSEGQQGYSEAPAYEDQAALDNYYSEEGPPAITYYEPPPDYAYLYAWDPYPFWWGGYFFPGFFVLNDFTFFGDFDHFGHGHHHDHWGEGGHDWHNHGMISNHGIDRGSHRTADMHNGTWGGRGGSFDRSSASNIVGRSFNHSSNTFVQRGGVMTRRDSNTVVGSGRSWGSSGWQGRSFNGSSMRSSNWGNRSFGGNSMRSFNGGSRSFNSGSMRSFGGGFNGGGRSFSGSSMRSFGGGGSFSRGFGGGGGHSFGGGGHGGGRGR